MLKNLLVASTVLAQGFLAAAAPHTQRTPPSPPYVDPISPSLDPFYTATPDFEKTAPGTVLKIRPAAGNLTDIVGAAAAFNVLYRTTDSQFKPDVAVTTIFVPVTDTQPALVSIQLPYNSANVDDSPSFTLNTDVLSQAEVIDSLKLGWFVNVPDFEGTRASFTAGVMSGHATIDSVRASLNLREKLGLPEGTRVALFGYSGGSLATEWATELAVQYAPELEFAGAAMGGLTANITSVMQTIDNGPFAGLIVSGIVGLSSQFPPVRDFVLSQIKPENLTEFLSVLALPAAVANIQFAFRNISDFFVNGIDAAMADPIVKEAVFSDQIMGFHGVPKPPVLAYHAVNDEVTPIADVEELVARYCEVGGNFLLTRNSAGGHLEEFVNGRQAAFDFLTAVFQGRLPEGFPADGCAVRDVTVDVVAQLAAAAAAA
ncbi:secretory lipase-domain-containing protein [Coniochaeta sp. 2T2.1]|nr:secretory lipase-domain-containing protein [Coniochaeta sp. 2T2.1]